LDLLIVLAERPYACSDLVERRPLQTSLNLQAGAGFER